MPVSEQLVRASRIMAVLAGVLAVACVAIDAATYIAPDALAPFGVEVSNVTGLSASVPLHLRLLALAVDLVPTALFAWALLELRRLFLFYAGGDVFGAGPLKALQRVATLMFAQVLTRIVAGAPISLLLSLANPPGQRSISFGIGSGDIGFVFLAGVALVIARVMAEARRVADENASFV